MKLLTCAALCGALALAACSGSSNPFGPSPTPQNVANTSLPYYLPLAQGNSWTFDDGEVINDTGSGQFSCSCPANGINVEELDISDSGGTYEGSLYFNKQTSGGRALTDFLGTSSSQGTGIDYISTPNYPDGLPAMDDSPYSGESWTDENGDRSTIGSVGQTVNLSNGQVAINVAQDTFAAASAANSFNWQFGQGIGFVTISSTTGSTTLSAFNVDTVNSYSVKHRTFRGSRALTPADLAIVRKLVTRKRSLGPR